MKMNRVFLLLAIILLPLFAFGQNDSLLSGYVLLQNKPDEKQVFFALPVFKKGHEVIPQKTIDQIQLLLNQFNTIESLSWIGTADLATPVYSNLSRGVLADKFYAANVNAIAAQRRASAAVEKWGGELSWKLVAKKGDRGLILTIRLKQSPPEIVDMYVVPEINVYPGQTFNLSGMAKVFWSNNVEQEQGISFSTTDSVLLHLDTLYSYGIAKQSGIAKIVVNYPKTSIVDTIQVNILGLPVPEIKTTISKWQLYGLYASHSYAGVGLMVKFSSGWLVNGEYSYVNWNINYEQAWNFKLGRQLKFIPSKFGELYFTAGIGRGEQLDGNWTSSWGSTGLLYDFYMSSGIHFLAGIDAQYKFKHQKAKVGPLEFYETENGFGYSQKVLRPEIKESKYDGRAWFGISIELN